MKKKKETPPALAAWILSKINSREDRLSILSDFSEIYEELAAEEGPYKARRWYWTQVLRSIPMFIINHLYWSAEMLKNYLKVAFRNIKRNKIFSFINISGLAIGMACCLLLMLFIRYELSFDRYHKNAKNIYRAAIKHSNSLMGTQMMNVTPGILAPFLREECPEVVTATKIQRRVSMIQRRGSMIQYKDKQFDDDRFFFADSEFLEVFTFPLIKGNKKTALKDPYSVLLTQDTAEKYFGDENPLGKVLFIDNKHEYTVKGVLQNVPRNSHFTFDILASMVTLESLRGQKHLFGWNNYKTYFILQKGADTDELLKKMQQIIDRTEMKDKFILQPLTDIHIYGNYNFELESNGDIRYIYLLSATTFLLMLIACFNFINLSTSRSVHRAKEVGMRKVIGATRVQLIKQLLGESLVISIIAFLISLALVKLLLPWFSGYMDRELRFMFFTDIPLLLALIALVFIVGLIAGSYPALFLSRFRPITVFTGILKSGSKGTALFRNSLVVVQLVITFSLITCTYVILGQLRYIHKKDLGFEKTHIVTAFIRDPNLQNNVESFMTELRSHPQIVDITLSNQLPFLIMNANPDTRWEGMEANKGQQVFEIHVDNNFIDFYDLKVMQGRKFSKEFRKDAEEACILNQTAARMTGWDDPLNKRYNEGTVIGVIKDFHFAPLNVEIAPLCLRLNRDPGEWLSIKVPSQDIPGALAVIKRIWEKYSMVYPFVYSFLDERIDRLYRAQQKLGQSITYFSAILIFVACLGLIGLASYTTEQKTKEIGIRKVLGASAGRILSLLWKQYVRWLILASLIAWPVAFYMMQKWLQNNFVYRTKIGIITFIFSAAVAFAITLISVGFQTIKAATANPVDSLRYE
jgi:putative ABC transport system permease protein